MDIQNLEYQAWRLVCRLNWHIEVHGVRHERLFDAYRHAYSRFQRRQDKLFIYKTGGFAPFPALQPPVVVGQGTPS
jgi:hypothetical protein